LYSFRSAILSSLTPSFHSPLPPSFHLSIHYFVLPHFIFQGFPFLLSSFFIPSFVVSVLRYFPLISNSISFLLPFYMEIGGMQIR
jgi:hypothetical protein